ncbi:MAG: ComF family protein [Gemmatimonadetes bacterium]|nr:MAG: ComF family protein [Gemmatimonadota bacterium]
MRAARWRGLAAPLGRRIAARALPFGGRAPARTIVVPLRTTAARARRRGFDQAVLLAQAAAGAAGLPVRDVLQRREGPSQVGLPADRRWDNVKHAFAVRAGASSIVRGRTVLLVDDVLTTGATASAAAVVLSRAGAQRVVLSTFARALPETHAS